MPPPPDTAPEPLSGKELSGKQTGFTTVLCRVCGRKGGVTPNAEGEDLTEITDCASCVQAALRNPPEPRPSGIEALVRPEFVCGMEAELRANAEKGDWRTWNPTPLQALAEMQHHEAKLMKALAGGDCERVAEYCADIANIAMKIDERFGGPKGAELERRAAK